MIYFCLTNICIIRLKILLIIIKMSYDPIAGNQNFSRVRDIASQVATLNASEVKASSISANKISSALPAIAPSFAAAPYGKTLFEIELKTPGYGVPADVVPLVRLDGSAYVVPDGDIEIISATLVGSSDLTGGIGGVTKFGTPLFQEQFVAAATSNTLKTGGVSVASPSPVFGSISGLPVGEYVDAGDSITVTPSIAFNSGSLRARLIYYT